MLKILLLLVSIFLNSSAQIFLKSASTSIQADKKTSEIIYDLVLSTPFILGMMCYALSIVMWIMVLSKIPVSVAYPMQALGYIFGISMAAFFLKENISFSMIVGMMFIIIGVIILGRNIA